MPTKASAHSFSRNGASSTARPPNPDLLFPTARNTEVHRRHLLVLLTSLSMMAGAAAQAPSVQAKTAPTKAVVSVAKPRWNVLSPAQKEALGPLQSQWDGFDAERKRKWLEMAARYPQLSPEGKQRFHERMPGYASLTAAQRATARDNFRRAYELPLEQRQSVVEQYTQLPEDKKQALAAQAKKPAEPTRRPSRTTRDLGKDSSRDDGKSPSRSAD